MPNCINRPVYACDVCRHQISPLANTIFHKSATPLKTWFEAIFEMSTTRTGYSAKALQRSTGVTYKTAWRMFKQIRSMLDENTGKLSGKVEADETYIGGARTGKRGRGAKLARPSLRAWLKDKAMFLLMSFPMLKPIPLFP